MLASRRPLTAETMLISHLQLCLAHYCEVHGPTPLMVTEGLSVPCSVCFDHKLPAYGSGGDRPRTSAQGQTSQATAVMSDAFRRMDLAGQHRSTSLPASELDAQAHRAALRRMPQVVTTPSTAVETPPTSPRRLTEPDSLLGHRHDSSFRKTYDDHVTRRANPCDNCAMTLPRHQSPGSDGSRRNPSGAEAPTLRTRVGTRARGGEGTDESPPDSRTASSSDTEGDEKPHVYSHRRTGTVASTTSRSSTSSLSRGGGHTHYLDYTSTHEPIVAKSYSAIRASCLRTLSFETLPRSPAAAGLRSPGLNPLVSPQTLSFVTTHGSGGAAAGGPIFFGDPVAGYTTAYIFRISDIHARGHKRVYAFLALSTYREWQAMKTFPFVSAAFHELATWVQQLADAEAERVSESSAASSPIATEPEYGTSALSAPPAPSRPAGPGSSFLAMAGSGLTRRMGSGFGGGSGALKARGLPELVGLPDFFIELHAKFVRLLLELGSILNAA
jgi:hypothetical protein